ncbi:major surface trophozoite antigen 11-like [Saccostrea cucullata]|uniref:major surface trophozoite antigen 11-like n=1 Tax=Saccostrea cuccullata TaxID=36930 RepID=UPI002ED37091
MFLALSDDYLGTEYVVPVYHDITWRSILGLGNPTNDDITVSLKFPEKRNFEGNLCPNETLDLTLQSYETESLTYSCDITGTRIVSSEKLIVYTASIPLSNSGGAEYLLEQLLPITLWGTHYVVVPLGDRPYGNVLTIVTAIDDTTIHISGYDFVTIPNNTEYIVTFPPLPPDDADSECLILSLFDKTSYAIPQLNLPTLNQLLPGDEEDNDQDGLVDEDNCLYFKDDYKAEVPSDLDLDGSDGEDCKGCPGGEGMNMFLTCEACDYGFYRERKSWKLRCQSCGENYTTFYQSSSSQNDCVPICTEGMQLNNDTSNNDTLYRENVVTGTLSSKSQTRVGGERKECEPCPVGYYKDMSAENTNLSVSDRFWCIQCPEGNTTYTERNVQFTDCIDICEEGFELQNNNSCAECEIGFYKNISSANTTASFEERWNCTACRENLTTLNRGTVHEEGCIEHCLEGSFWNGSVCLPCPVGEYKNTSSKDLSLSYELRWNCTQCKDGKTTYRSGTNKDACLEHCLEGLYLADNGTCVLCDIGYFKNTSSKNVTLSENLRWNCTKCPDGKTTRTLGSRECKQ